jgi:hypothetical protein
MILLDFQTSIVDVRILELAFNNKLSQSSNNNNENYLAINMKLTVNI